MERLTTYISGYPHGRRGRNFDIALKEKEYHRGCFECTAIVERLCSYEDTGLTPKEIKALQVDNEKLHRLVDEMDEALIGK